MALINFTGQITSASPSCPVLPDGAQALVAGAGTDTFPSAVTIYVGVTGNVTILPLHGGASVTFVGVPAGVVVPCRAAGIDWTTTTAASLVAIY